MGYISDMYRASEYEDSWREQVEEDVSNRKRDHQMIHDLSDIYEKGSLTDWEQSFIESLSDQIDRGAILTNKQRRKLADIYEERMLEH